MKRRKSRKNGKKVLIATVAACLLSGAFVTYALTETKLLKYEDNVLYPAEIEIAVLEGIDSADEAAAAVASTKTLTLTWNTETDEDQENVITGYSATKQVTVINIDAEDKNNADAYIRVCLLPRWTAAVNGTAVDVTNTAVGLSDFGSLTDIVIEDNTYTMGDVTFSLAADWETYWLFNPKDGYFYYRRSVSPGEETAQLLAEVHISDDTWNIISAYGVTLAVDVLSDAIQTVGGAPENRWSEAGIEICTDEAGGYLETAAAESSSDGEG